MSQTYTLRPARAWDSALIIEGPDYARIEIPRDTAVHSGLASRRRADEIAKLLLSKLNESEESDGR